MRAMPIVLVAASLLIASVLLSYVSFDSESSDPEFKVVFYNSDDTVLEQGVWSYREVPYCVKDPLVPDGKRFVGWSTESGSEVVGEVLPVESDISYYPVIVDVSMTVSLMFQPNNSMDASRTVFVIHGSEYRMPYYYMLGFSQKDDLGPFVFMSWSTSGTEYAVDDMFHATEDAVFVAQWMRETAVVPKFIKLPEVEVSIDRFDDVTLEAQCSEQGCGELSFEWFMMSGSEYTSIGYGSQMPLPSGISFFPGEYFLYVVATNLDQNALNKVSSSTSHVISIKVTGTYVLTVYGTDYVSEHLANERVVVPHIVMDGNVLVDLLLGDGTSIFGSVEFLMPAEDVVLFPVWDVVQHTLTFLSEGAVIDEVTEEHGCYFTVPECTIAIEGSFFDGWRVDGVRVSPGSLVSVKSDMSFDAIWVPNAPTYYLDGVMYHGATVTLPLDGVVYWVGSNGVMYLPGETVIVIEGLSFRSVRLSSE